MRVLFDYAGNMFYAMAIMTMTAAVFAATIDKLAAVGLLGLAVLLAVADLTNRRWRDRDFLATVRADFAGYGFRIEEEPGYPVVARRRGVSLYWTKRAEFDGISWDDEEAEEA